MNVYPLIVYYTCMSIQRFTDTQVCAVAKAEDLSYDVMLSDNTDCEDVMVDENGVRVLCNTKDMTGNVTIHVCGGSFCKSLITPLSESHTHARTHARMHAHTHARTHTHTHTHIHTHTHTRTHTHTFTHSFLSFSADVSCNRATWGFCKEDSIDTTITADKYEIRFRANFATYDGDWAIEVVSSSGEDGRILVRDVFGGVSVGQPQIALYDATFDCDGNGMFDLHLLTHTHTHTQVYTSAHTQRQMHTHMHMHIM